MMPPTDAWKEWKQIDDALTKVCADVARVATVDADALLWRRGETYATLGALAEAVELLAKRVRALEEPVARSINK